MKTRRVRPGGGAALILTALICICLLCFAALTVVSAQADRRLTQQYEDLTAAYYEAYSEGQTFLAETDAQLQTIYEETAARASYFEEASRLDSAIDPEDPEGAWYDEIQAVLANTGPDAEDAGDDEAPLLLFTKEISDTQVYFLLVCVQYPDAAGDDEENAGIPGAADAGSGADSASSEDTETAEAPEDDAEDADPVTGGNVFYQILSSKTVTTVTYDYDTSLHLLTD